MAIMADGRAVMTLFSSPTCFYSHRTRLVMAEKNINIEIVTIEGSDMPEDLLDLNPSYPFQVLISMWIDGYVDALSNDSQVLWDAGGTQKRGNGADGGGYDLYRVQGYLPALTLAFCVLLLGGFLAVRYLF